VLTGSETRLSVPLRYVTYLYELPRARLPELREAATREGQGVRSNDGRLADLLASLRQLSSPQEAEPYLAALLAYLNENGIVATQPAEHQDLLMDLVEFHGDGWDLVEPNPQLPGRLDPSRFDEAALRRFYDQEDEECSEAGPAMLRDLEIIQRALGQLSPNSLLLVHHR
jgi:hypothetical protein